MDKVRGSDQPDVVSSPSAWFVGFALNSCFLFLIHSETLNPQLSFLAAHQSCSQICWWGQFSASQDFTDPSAWQIQISMQEGLCFGLVCLKTHCPTNSLPREMGSGSWCCPFLGLLKSYSGMTICLCPKSSFFLDRNMFL